MNIKKILTIALTLVMGIALTGVLATNINNVENEGYIEYDGARYDLIKIVEQNDTNFALYNENGELIDESADIYITAENVYVSKFVLDENWYASTEVTPFNTNHKYISFNMYHEITEIGFDVQLSNFNDELSYVLLNDSSFLDDELIISVYQSTTLTLLSFVPLIFAGIVVAFVYNSRFD